MNLRKFFAELKRRNVYKVAVAYAIVGWLVMQIAATVVPALHLSDAITSAVVLLTLLGFPIALVLAWAFELTPEGIKRAEDVDLSKSVTPKTGRKLTVIMLAIFVIALSLLVFQLTRPHPAMSVAKPPGVPNDKSVAVLPFANLSRDPDNAYFAAGIQDEIITRLAKITELKVISCTSTQRFKKLSALSKQRYVSAYSFALVYLGLGDKEEALRWLAKSYQDRAGDALRYIRVEPLLDPLRSDPRFEELVAKIFAPKNGSSP
jgi:hypothetical protein